MMNRSTFSLFGDSSVIPPVNWQKEPNNRGTWSIISTCSITLGLCLWTALRLNIPAHHGKSSQKWRKLGWLLVGLFAPEMVVYTALGQRRAALRLTKEMGVILGNAPEPGRWRRLLSLRRRKAPIERDGSTIELSETSSQSRSHPWTHVHSFYALMGGFAFDTSGASPNFLPGGRSRLTLRSQALIYIAERAPSLIPDLPADEIQEKSKADGFAKFLVCMQALWFCLQCIVRMTQKHAIAFLELNTFAHAICALLIYGVWWHKPLDIESPTLLKGEEAWEFCALMCVTSNGESFGKRSVSRFLFWRIFSSDIENWWETELGRGQKYGDRVIMKWSDVFNGKHLARLRVHRFEPRMILQWDPARDSTDDDGPRSIHVATVLQGIEVQPSYPSKEVFRIKKGDCLFGLRCMDVYTHADWYRAMTPLPFMRTGYQRRTVLRDTRNRNGIEESERYCTLDTSDLRRWDLVSRAWQKYQPKSAEYDPLALDAILRDQVCDRMHDWPSITWIGMGLYGLSQRNHGMQLLTFTIAGGLYGGLHLLAWNAPFADTYQQFLWRASAVVIASSGVIWLVNDVATIAEMVCMAFFDSNSNQEVLFFIVIPVVEFCLTGATLFFIVARVFLVLECCLQIARLPPGAFEIPEWSRYWSHIG